MSRLPGEKERFTILMEEMKSGFKLVFESIDNNKIYMSRRFDEIDDRFIVLEKAVTHISKDVADIKVQLIPMQEHSPITKKSSKN